MASGLPNTWQFMTAAQNGSPTIVEAQDLRRRYGEGEAAVDALADVSVGFPTGALRRDHGPVGLGQVDADAHPRRPRPAHLGHRPHRRHRADRRSTTSELTQAAPRPHRLHLPDLQPAAGAQRRREHPAAAVDRRAQARPRVVRPARRHGRHPRPPQPPPGRALGRPAAARRGRARAGLAPGGRVRRRALRQPRLESLGRRARRCCATPSTTSTRRS